jgi:hypothetical protein
MTNRVIVEEPLCGPRKGRPQWAAPTNVGMIFTLRELTRQTVQKKLRG